MVTIEPAVGSVAEGAQFVVRAAPAPRADLVVGVTITPSGCALMNEPTSVTIAAGKKEAMLQVQADAAGVGSNGCTVTAAIDAGEGYRKGDAASARATLPPNQQTPDPQEPPPPVVIIAANASTVTEGSEVSFTLTAMPKPASDLTVTVSWSEDGSFLPASPPAMVTIPTTGTAELKVSIPDDRVDEQDGSVTATVEAGSGYTVGTQGAATVAVTDNDPAASGGPAAPAAPPPRSEPPANQEPVVSIATAATSVTEGGTVLFTLTANPAPSSNLSVKLACAVLRRVGELQTPHGFTCPPPVTISASSSTATLTVTAPDDSVKNAGTARLTVAVEDGTGYVPASIAVAGVRLVDDEAG